MSNFQGNKKKGRSDKVIPLTNNEVVTLLKELKSEQGRDTPSSLATITYEMLRYFENTPAALPGMPDAISSAMGKLMKLPCKLSHQHIYQIVNDPPLSPLDLQVLFGPFIHELKEDDVHAILRISKDSFDDLLTAAEKRRAEEAERLK